MTGKAFPATQLASCPPTASSCSSSSFLKKNKAEYQYPNFNYIVCEILRCKVSTQLS